MFKKTSENSQLDLLSGVPSMLEGKALEQYIDNKEWQNIFREQVLMKIDETKFKVLFSETGAPNASIKLMVSMMILKEAKGWSDKQLFEEVQFNLLVRRALGLYNLNDKVMTPSTYYLFRKKVCEYEEQTGINLIELSFQDITSKQAIEFNVNGNSVRMDSKLIGSNIAYYSRYEIIHETLRMFYKELPQTLKQKISQQEKEELELILKEKGNEIVYRSTKEKLEERMQSLGLLIWKLLQMFKGSEVKLYATLQRVFEDHYKVEEQSNRVIIKDKKEIASTSVQSPHDPECTYRNKKEQKIKGYHSNITETCDDNSLNLITAAQIDVASTSENEFMKEGIEKTETVLVKHINDLHADGAYHSTDNDDYCEENNINFYLTGIQGSPGRYDLSNIETDQTVTDTQTSEIIPAVKTKSGNWKIKTEKGVRYFKPEEIKICQIRKSIAELPPEIKNKRCNVEATIFQLCFYTRNNKTRYRGLFKHKIWMFFRCLWINFVRIAKYVLQLIKNDPKLLQNLAGNTFFSIISTTKLLFLKGEFNFIGIFFRMSKKLIL